jgi:uncharacterized metal-binding protein YceD (DUF177 family)
LRELAEEELLLALPAVAMHTPEICGAQTDEADRAQTDEADSETQDTLGDRSRPFAALQDLLKKT